MVVWVLFVEGLFVCVVFYVVCWLWCVFVCVEGCVVCCVEVVVDVCVVCEGEVDGCE